MATLPGVHAYEYRSDEPGDGCWDSLLGLAREGVRVYRLPDLETDVSRTFQRTELGGLTLEVRLVDGVRVGYLRESSVDARRSTVDELVAAVGEVPAELIKHRLVAFLRWPCNARGLHYEWGEVVDALFDPSRDPSDNAHPDDLFVVTVARTSKGPEWWAGFAAAGEPFAVSEVSREDAIAKARTFMATHGWRDDMGDEVGLLLIRQYERGRDDEAVARGGFRIHDEDRHDTRD